jgi:hypothetical protein
MSASIIDLFEREHVRANLVFRNSIINNYHYFRECVNVDLIGCIWFLACAIYFICNENTCQLTVSVLAIAFTIFGVVGSYYFITKIVDKLMRVTEERDDMEEMLNEMIEENDRLKKKLIEYDTYIQNFNRKRISSSSDEDFSKLNIEDDEDA